MACRSIAWNAEASASEWPGRVRPAATSPQRWRARASRHAARPRHTAKAVIRDGITVRGPGERRLHARPARTVVAGQAVEPVDVTLFCVKAYDTAQAAEDIAALVGERGLILCLQNGIANEEVLASVYGSDRILSGVLYIGAERAELSVIDCRTGARIIFGSYDGQPNELLGRVQSVLSEAGVDCTVEASIRPRSGRSSCSTAV